MPSQKPARIKRKDALVDELFAKAALRPGEKTADYEAIRRSFLQALQPRHTLERMFALEIVAKTWDILRLQRYRNEVLIGARADAVEEMLEPALGLGAPPLGIKQAWLARDPKVLDNVQRHLKQHKLGREHLDARAYTLKLPEIERINQQISQLEQSRSRALKDIAQLDAILSKRLAEEMKTIEGKFRRDDDPKLAPPVLDDP